MYIIGFGSTAQVGKDTAAEYLEKKFPGRVKRVSFADKVKEVSMELYDLTREQCYGPKEIKEKVDPRYGKSPRELMQRVGDKLRKLISETIWIDVVFDKTIPEYLAEGYNVFVVSDVRYPNEGNKVLQEKGTLVKIVRDAGGTSVGADHPSETSMKDYKEFDFIIENNGSLEEYFKKLDRLMEEINYNGREAR